MGLSGQHHAPRMTVYKEVIMLRRSRSGQQSLGRVLEPNNGRLLVPHRTGLGFDSWKRSDWVLTQGKGENLQGSRGRRSKDEYRNR
jgi:hypothetical protein